MPAITCKPAGDRAICIDFGNVIDEGVNARVHELCRVLNASGEAAIKEMIPSYRSLLICYDPFVRNYGQMRTIALEAAEKLGAVQEEKKHVLKVPVCYGARFGPDFEEMEQHTGLDRDEIIAIHSSKDYKIYMMGFLPGFCYLGGMDERIACPRRSSPRLKIFQGAVGIGGKQTGIYPMESPGGWQLIGGTPIMLYEPQRDPAILVKAGDYIRFVPVTIDDYYDIRRDICKGIYSPEWVVSDFL